MTTNSNIAIYTWNKDNSELLLRHRVIALLHHTKGERASKDGFIDSEATRCFIPYANGVHDIEIGSIIVPDSNDLKDSYRNTKEIGSRYFWIVSDVKIRDFGSSDMHHLEISLK